MAQDASSLPGPFGVALDAEYPATGERDPFSGEPYKDTPGYVGIILRFALTNRTNQPVEFPSNAQTDLSVTVRSSEGYKYDAGSLPAPGLLIPPGFRLPTAVYVQVAATAHNLHAVVTSSGCSTCSADFVLAETVPGTKAQFHPSFPGDRTGMGAAIANGPVTYTILDGALVDYCSNGIGSTLVTLKVQAQNNFGYDATVNLDTALIDAAGESHRVEPAIRGYGGSGSVPPGMSKVFPADYEVGLNLDACHPVDTAPPYELIVHVRPQQAPDGSTAGSEEWLIIDVPTPAVSCTFGEGACA